MTETIRSRLEADLKSAMRARDEPTRDAIRYILAAVKNAEIEHRGNPAEANAVAALRRLGKQLADSMEQYRAAGREDLASREEGQLAVLRRYLPAEMGDDDLRRLAEAVAAELGASGPKEMGKVMPVLLGRVDGRADGRRVSAAAKEVLSGGGAEKAAR